MVHRQFPPDPDQRPDRPAPLPQRHPVWAVLTTCLPVTLLLLAFAVVLLATAR